MRLIPKGGYNWTDPYPWIVQSALKNHIKHFVIDGEAVVLGVDGISDFGALHSRKQMTKCSSTLSIFLHSTARTCAACRCRCARSTCPGLLARRPDGIFAAPFEQGEIGPDLFRKACEFGLEGLVSKRADRPYRAGRSKDWLKIKNREHPAMSRAIETF